MGNYNNNNYGATKKKGFTPGRKSKEEYEADRAKQIAKQTHSLEIIDQAAWFMNEFLKNSENYKITMKEVLNFLNNEKGYEPDDTKVISQFNYIMMDLANARKNPRVSGDRINIRVLYLEERLKTSFKSELHERALEIVEKYTNLFGWDKTGTGESYQTLTEKE